MPLSSSSSLAGTDDLICDVFPNIISDMEDRSSQDATVSIDREEDSPVAMFFNKIFNLFDRIVNRTFRRLR